MLLQALEMGESEERAKVPGESWWMQGRPHRSLTHNRAEEGNLRSSQRSKRKTEDTDVMESVLRRKE